MLHPIERRDVIYRTTFLRDFMHEQLTSMRNKTSKAILRRLKYIMKNAQTQRNVEVFVGAKSSQLTDVLLMQLRCFDTENFHFQARRCKTWSSFVALRQLTGSTWRRNTKERRRTSGKSTSFLRPSSGLRHTTFTLSSCCCCCFCCCCCCHEIIMHCIVCA